MATTSISGLDVQSLVSQLMAVERKPIDKLNAKISDYQSKISSFGTLNSLVSSLQTAARDLKTSLQGFNASPADATILTATASSSAAAGMYTIEVSRLAQAQTLVSTGQVSQTISIPSSPATITFTIGGNPMDVTIPAGATLEGIRDAINGANLGITASIINDGSATPYRLVLTANEAGTSKAISNITSSDAGLNALLNYDGTVSSAMEQKVTPQTALFTVNNIDIESTSNTYTDAIQGVTLTLKKETTAATTLTVARDTEAVSSAATKFVDAYNALYSQLKSRSAYGSSTTTAGALAGDNTVRQMLDQLRDIFMTPASGGTLNYLSEIGITTQAGGSLTVDSSKLVTTLTANFAEVDNLFNGATGFATRLDTWATSVIQTGGLISRRTDSLNSSIKSYNEQIDRLELRMTALQKQYTTTYTNLNMLLSSMNDTSNYLTSQFS